MDIPVRSVKELIALARGRPGELNYGSGGIGASQALESGNKTPEQFSDYIKSEAGKWGS
jgi:hypothetical protein